MSSPLKLTGWIFIVFGAIALITIGEWTKNHDINDWLAFAIVALAILIGFALLKIDENLDTSWKAHEIIEISEATATSRSCIACGRHYETPSASAYGKTFHATHLDTSQETGWDSIIYKHRYQIRGSTQQIVCNKCVLDYRLKEAAWLLFFYGLWGAALTAAFVFKITALVIILILPGLGLLFMTPEMLFKSAPEIRDEIVKSYSGGTFTRDEHDTLEEDR